jgi:hypothetical protein
MSIKYASIFDRKTLPNLPQFGFLAWKYAIWQPWLESFPASVLQARSRSYDRELQRQRSKNLQRHE